MNLAMIPARMGSQRLKQKNLREIDGVSLVARCIRKCQAAGCFDEIWVNSEHDAFGDIAAHEAARFHKRPEHLADNFATSEQFVAEFLGAHECERLFQVHSIAPLLSVEDVRGFVYTMETEDWDTLLSCTEEQIECALDGKPVNFTFAAKQNSQDLPPVQRVSWSITGWRRDTYLAEAQVGRTATYAGRIGFHPVGRLAGHVIKDETDLRIAEALLPLVDA